MSEIFYSQVDTNLQDELNARAGTARRRSTRDIEFMVGKIGNATVIPYVDSKKETPIVEAILGGITTRNAKFLPSGPDGFLGLSVDNKSVYSGDSLYRTPPFITSAEIAIGDHSMGLLNTATVNFTIPNPEDIQFIEGVYFKPGRFAEVIIEHPKSACVSQTTLTATQLESYNKIAALYPNLKHTDYDDKYRRINKVSFEGLITSFTFDYQPDFSITATLSLRGTSNVYTDVSLIVDSNQTQPEKQEKPNSKETKDPDAEVDTFFQNLQSLFESAITKDIAPSKPPTYCRAVPLKDKITLRANSDITIQSRYLDGVVGVPSKTMSTEQRYITLACLVQYINDYCLQKLRETEDNTLPSAFIIFNEEICKSTYYDPKYYKSCNPERIFFPDKANRTYEHQDSKKNLEWFGKIDGTNDVAEIRNWPPFVMEDGNYTPATIMINLNVIDEIVKALKVAKTFTVGELLKSVSDEVYRASGNSIELTLTTHPEDHRFLIWYDAKFVTKGPIPYDIPMISNDPRGQIVRDFKFSGKLPDSAAHLAYALNQDLSSMSESDIAPYVSYLYAQNDNDAYPDPNVKAAIEKYEKGDPVGKAKEAYTKSHTEATTKLIQTIQTYATEATKINSDALYDALQKYIQFPKPTIEQTNNVAAPVIPFDTEFTVDGINGFKYGDVLTFSLLPARYIKNTVFSVINVTHTIGSDGVWTTTIRSIMRPKFD